LLLILFQEESRKSTRIPSSPSSTSTTTTTTTTPTASKGRKKSKVATQANYEDQVATTGFDFGDEISEIIGARMDEELMIFVSWYDFLHFVVCCV
jgi:hypothetical protein